jgi:organic radical activating enzyme
MKSPKLTLKVNAIYATYQGEQNINGIGSPVIFVRTQGCHIRCYLKTIGVLCDTPEALDINDKTGLSKEMYIHEVVEEVERISEMCGGIKLVCLSGGDPLKQDKIVLHNLFFSLNSSGYKVSVETSGTIDISEFLSYKDVHFVLDYKSKSAGIKLTPIAYSLKDLRKTDTIKFVLYDNDDYEEFLRVFDSIYYSTVAKITVGLYWGGKLKYSELIERLIKDKIFGLVTVNVQLHKLLTLYDKTTEETFFNMEIPKKI